MKKMIVAFITLLIAASLLLSGCITGSDTPADNTGEEISVTDSLGRTVSVPANAQKFVAIGPGCLRLYCYVGNISQIVGIEQAEVTSGVGGRPYAMANPELLELPIIGAGGPNNAPDAEKILEVDPDVIFTLYNSEASAIDELENKTNIPVVTLSYGETEVFDPVLAESLELIGKITGNEERAAEVTRFLSECKEDLDSRTGDIAFEDKPTVYLGAQSSWGTHGIESTRGHYSLFMAVNVRNVVEETGIYDSVILDKEKLLDLDPDIIFIDGGGLANVQEDYISSPKYYQGLSAFKTGEVYMQLPYNYFYTNIDIALCNAYYIGSIIYAERFSDINIASKSNEIFKKLLGKELYAQVAEEYFGGFQKLDLENSSYQNTWGDNSWDGTSWNDSGSDNGSWENNWQE
jgi:iron complex transport system substrate-binding protein